MTMHEILWIARKICDDIKYHGSIANETALLISRVERVVYHNYDMNVQLIIYNNGEGHVR